LTQAAWPKKEHKTQKH